MKRSLVGAGLAMFGLAGCSQVNAIRHPIQFVAERTPQEVWVVRRHNDSTFAVQQPRLQGDTIVGFLVPTAQTLTQYVEIPGTDIKQMRAREPAPVRTGALVAGTVGALVFTWMQLVHGSGRGEVDAYFRTFLVRNFRLGARLPPGFFRICVGP